MELRVLRYFVEAARAGNISRAAAALHVSQPAMSKQLRALEDELGTKLFKRTNYNILLTAEGMLFRQRAEDILAMVRQAKNEFETMGNDVSGDVHIGGAESEGFRCVARAMKAVREAHPKIRFHIYSGNREDLDYRLEKGLLDFVLTLQAADEEQFDTLTLPDADEWGVVMRKDAPLAKKKHVRVDDLSGLPLIVSREAMGAEYPAWFGAAFSSMDAAVTFNLVYNAAVMVREGLGYLLSIGGLVDTGADSDLCFRTLSPQMTSPLYVVWRKHRPFSPAASILLEEMKKRYADGRAI
ncbi:MAG: LysR family transcriptional regulator [Schwartzia sp.]|nr:LysR family transcriptional regulator [Schwartzia sp. (in: firmicutes)]